MKVMVVVYCGYDPKTSFEGVLVGWGRWGDGSAVVEETRIYTTDIDTWSAFALPLHCPRFAISVKTRTFDPLSRIKLGVRPF